MRMKKDFIPEFCGWYGVIAILVAYSLLNFGLVDIHSLLYQILNATGALGIAYDALKDKDYQPIVLNIIWALIALVAIVKIIN